MAGSPGKKGRKVGRHDRGPHHHTPEQAIQHKAKRVFQSSGAVAYIAYCELHKLFGRITGGIKARAEAEQHAKFERRHRHQKRHAA